jgi:hypothetical protein
MWQQGKDLSGHLKLMSTLLFRQLLLLRWVYKWPLMNLHLENMFLRHHSMIRLLRFLQHYHLNLLLILHKLFERHLH